ncbi:MAG: holo-ACP synthase [Pseudomonadota bacterium]
MIIGIGSDIADIRRIARTLERFGDRFVQRVFTEAEQRTSERRRNRADSYARRWAAKEACSKALGTGLRMGVAWREMGVVNLRSGQPTLRLTGGAHERMMRLIPEGLEPRLHVTMTDDPPYAQAFVILEAVPPDTPAPPGAKPPDPAPSGSVPSDPVPSDPTLSEPSAD